MMFLLIHIFIRMIYPSDSIEDIRRYNEILDRSMHQFCFLDIEYDLVKKDTLPDLYIHHKIIFENPIVLGLTSSSIHYNPKIYGIPKIYLIETSNDILLEKILIHEIGHFLGYDTHSIDPQSIFYSVINDLNNQKVTRYDTLKLKELFFLN